MAIICQLAYGVPPVKIVLGRCLKHPILSHSVHNTSWKNFTGLRNLHWGAHMDGWYKINKYNDMKFQIMLKICYSNPKRQGSKAVVYFDQQKGALHCFAIIFLVEIHFFTFFTLFCFI